MTESDKWEFKKGIKWSAKDTLGYKENIELTGWINDKVFSSVPQPLTAACSNWQHNRGGNGLWCMGRYQGGVWGLTRTGRMRIDERRVGRALTELRLGWKGSTAWLEWGSWKVEPSRQDGLDYGSPSHLADMLHTSDSQPCFHLRINGCMFKPYCGWIILEFLFF